MGISGLIPFIRCCTDKIDIKQLSGKTVAVDSYCWLHKGVIGCAEKLLMGEQSTQYVDYCMKMVKLLLANNVKVIMVFDGRPLPAKKQVETSRQKARVLARNLARQHLRVGKHDLARRYMIRSIDVTHSMALKLIKACRQLNVDCIVAPYEADAQLTYLSLNSLTDFVITEDSDLILFGCKKVIFKFTVNGQGLLYTNTNLNQTMNLPETSWDFRLFQRMCILSGCDYLRSLQGIGLMRARTFLLKTQGVDFYEALKKMGLYLKMDKLEVPDTYIKSFIKCETIFLYQFVYDPVKRKQVHLTELTADVPYDSIIESGILWDSEEAYQHALGNIDPETLKRVDNWNPDTCRLPSTSIWNKKIHRTETVTNPETFTNFPEIVTNLPETVYQDQKCASTTILNEQVEHFLSLYPQTSPFMHNTQCEGTSLEVLRNKRIASISSKFGYPLLTNDEAILGQQVEHFLSLYPSSTPNMFNMECEGNSLETARNKPNVNNSLFKQNSIESNNNNEFCGVQTFTDTRAIANHEAFVNQQVDQLLSLYRRSPTSIFNNEYKHLDTEVVRNNNKVFNPFSLQNVKGSDNHNENSKFKNKLSLTCPKSMVEEVVSVKSSTSPEEKNSTKVRSPVLNSVRSVRSSFLKRKRSSENERQRLSCYFKSNNLRSKFEQPKIDPIVINLIDDDNDTTETACKKEISQTDFISVIEKNDNQSEKKHIKRHFLKIPSSSVVTDLGDCIDSKESVQHSERKNLKQDCVEASSTSQVVCDQNDGIQKFSREKNVSVKMQPCHKLGLSKNKLASTSKQSLLDRFGYVKKSMVFNKEK